MTANYVSIPTMTNTTTTQPTYRTQRAALKALRNEMLAAAGIDRIGYDPNAVARRPIDYTELMDAIRADVVRTLSTYNGLMAYAGLGPIVDPATIDRLRRAKVMYGLGLNGRYRGITCYGAWQPGDEQEADIIEIAAAGQESPCQVACTMRHELAHIIAGIDAAHGRAWKDACTLVGLRNPRQAGQHYYPVTLRPDARAHDIAAVARLSGAPSFVTRSDVFGMGLVRVAGGCKFGHKKQAPPSNPTRTYACECGTRIESRDSVAAILCQSCDSPFSPVSNGRRGRPRKVANA